MTQQTSSDCGSRQYWKIDQHSEFFNTESEIWITQKSEWEGVWNLDIFSEFALALEEEAWLYDFMTASSESMFLY